MIPRMKNFEVDEYLKLKIKNPVLTIGRADQMEHIYE